MYPDGFNQIDNGVQGSVTVFTVDRGFVNMQHADLFPVGGFNLSLAPTLFIRRVEYDIEREIKALGQSGLPRADWIAKSLLAAAPQMPKLTLKLHAQPGLRLHHNHQQQIPRTNPALPLGKPLPPLNPTSLATKTE